MKLKLIEGQQSAARDVAWEAYRERMAAWCSRETFDAHAREFDCILIEDEHGHPVGAVMLRGSTIHIAILPAFRKRWATRRFIQELLSRCGVVATTCAMPEDRQFVERIGFRPVAQKGVVTRYELCR